MEAVNLYRILADAVLLIHLAVVVFVVGGLLLIVIGHFRGWRWVNALWFRLLHLITVGIIVLQAWLGELCPLTILEIRLRELAGEIGYSASFIEHWVQQILYYDAPFWLFTLIYTLFGLAVVGVWWCFPPTRKH